MTTLNETTITGDLFVEGKIYEKNSTELDKIIPTDVGIKDNKLGLVHDSTWLTNQDAINLKGFDYNADTNTLALDSTTLNVINRAYLRPVTKPSVLDICAQDNTGGQVNVELGSGLSYDSNTKKIIPNLDEFKRADGSGAFEKVEGSAKNTNINWIYIRCGVSANIATFVFAGEIPNGVTIRNNTQLATIIPPKVVLNHIGMDANKTYALSALPIIDKSTKAIDNIVAFIQGYNTEYNLMFSTDITNSSGNVKAFRAEFTFIL